MKLYSVGRTAWIPMYNRACPRCGAPAGHFCLTSDGKPARPAHRSRGNRPKANSIPDLRDWWRSMSLYEGQHAQPQPSSLVVP